MNLPESVLLCLFPNGLVLSRQSVAVDGGDGEEEEEVYAVDVRRTREDCSVADDTPVRPRLLPIRAILLQECL